MKKQLQYLKEKNVWEIQVPCLDEEKGTIFTNHINMIRKISQKKI